MRRLGTILAAGALVASSAVMLSTTTASAVTTVSTEAQLRDAWGNPDETSISLAADIDLTDCEASDVDRNSDTPISLEGNGHTITQTCDDSRVLYASGKGAVALDDVVLTGAGHLGGGGGGLFADTDATITNSTLTGNAAGGGGAVFTFGSITVVNSTITGNSSPNDGDFAGFGGGLESRDITLIYSTVVGNSSPTGANIQIDSTDTLVSFSSVVGTPLGGGDNCHFGGGQSTTSHGYNYSDDSSCGFTNTGLGDHQDVADLGLGPLADNGGNTPTMLPGADSPLLDATPTAACQSGGATDVTTDQRDLPRPSGTGCDVGAVEVQVAVTTTTQATTTTTAATPVVVQPQFTG